MVIGDDGHKLVKVDGLKPAKMNGLGIPGQRAEDFCPELVY